MFKNITSIVAIAATVWVVGATAVQSKGPAKASDILSPKLVFVTSRSDLTGDLGGVDGADAICQAAADMSTISWD